MKLGVVPGSSSAECYNAVCPRITVEYETFLQVNEKSAFGSRAPVTVLVKLLHTGV